MMLSLALAEAEGVERLSSSRLANGLGANPSFVRKLILPLARHGLVDSTMGRSGGICLGRSAEAITLGDIYAAVIGDRSLWVPRKDVPHQCLVSCNVERFFLDLAAEADEAVLVTLAQRTLAGSLSELRTMEVNRKRRSLFPKRKI
jgi:Rrf2 family transcriptional repressor of oqxAB